MDLEPQGDPSPQRLLDLLIEFTLSHLQTICVMDTNNTVVRLRDDVFLPSIICDKIVNTLSKRRCINDAILQAMSDTGKVQLKKINLSRTAMSDVSFEKLANHKLTELDISECDKLSNQCLVHLLRLTSLQLLNLSKCGQVLEKYGLPMFDFPLTNLRSLNIGYTELSGVQLHCLVKHLRNLTALDVSKVVRNGDLSFLEPVKQQLRFLVLHDCILVESSLEYICDIRGLRHLDISVNNEGYLLPLTTAMLRRLTRSLPVLTSLDLSGNDIRKETAPGNHNNGDGEEENAREDRHEGGEEKEDDVREVDPYAESDASFEDDDEEEEAPPARDVADYGPAPQQHNEMEVEEVEEEVVAKAAGGDARRLEEEELNAVPSSIEGLKGLPQKLSFLGLVGMDECELEHIPAVKVAGLATEDQILQTIETYVKRRGFLLKGLNAYFDLLRVINCQMPLRAVRNILEAMKRYPSDNQIQISGSASLFHLTRGQYKKQLNKYWRQAIISCLLDAIEGVSDSVTLLRNCGLTLFNFSIPDDFQFQFERVVSNLVKLALTEDREGLLQRVYVHMCNSIVCHVEGSQKLLVGRLGIIKCMLKLIKDRLERKICDEVMETAWSTLWNVTDETADNCEMFLLGNGMQLFLRCKETFRERPELLRNMMGLMGNVAEVKRLRSQLIPHVSVFAALLSDRSDGIEVSYNAAGALAHMASDGEEAWTSTLKREDVLHQMEAAIESWQLNEQRNINYRSFEPILRLIHTYHTPQVQLWATWALANLCTVSRDKYCSLLVKEDGPPKLRELVDHPAPSPRVKELVTLILNLCQEYQNTIRPAQLPYHPI